MHVGQAPLSFYNGICVYGILPPKKYSVVNNMGSAFPALTIKTEIFIPTEQKLGFPEPLWQKTLRYFGNCIF